ncbi:penicillin-binding protein 2 [Paratractidigestivibacter sp.]|uniref:penicillin-binding protein 2 n=1 Tax=Paratractidigestivibacter sp. TaxID=2847316 RepID=UPI002ABD9C63|nr:penicillin-binding protein 2 [Paratractidigestivibacter sp.]
MDLSLVIVIVCALIACVLIILYIVFGRSEAAYTLDIGGAAPRAAGGRDESSESAYSSRLMGFAVVIGGVFTTLLARLWSMQLVSSEDYIEQAELNRTRTVTTAAPRGRILDRNGEEIVTNRSSLTVVAESGVSEDEIEMQILANLIGMPKQAVYRKIIDTSEGAQSLRTVSTDVSRRVVAFIGEHPSVFEGVTVQQRSQRSYPQGSLAAHVVGYTGTVTSEQLEGSDSGDDSAVEYKSGDIVGQSGVESMYESVLQGIRGEQTVYVNSSGEVLSTSTTIDPQSGSDLVLTIDLAIQKAAEESLQAILKSAKDRGNDAVGGSVVCLDCTNGEILAMASAPTFSPSIFVGGIATSDWESLTDEDSNYPLLNRAISGQYPSASTIKAMTSFAALDYGVATPQTGYDCTGWWTGFGESYGMHCYDYSGHGHLNLQGGITMSCDTVFYEIGKGFYNSSNQEGMQETFRKYGLGSKTGIDLPSESEGRVPDAEWKWNHFSYLPDVDRQWQPGEYCNIAIGQGDILVTALQIAQAYSSIANRGPIYKPHVLKSVKSSLGSGSVVEYSISQVADIKEDAAYRTVVENGLRGVIYDESEVQASHWNNLSVKVCGKTGTGEQSSTGRNICWMVAYAPADNPKYVISANVDGGDWGSTTAMYIVRDVFGQIYGEADEIDRSSTSSATQD